MKAINSLITKATISAAAASTAAASVSGAFLNNYVTSSAAHQTNAAVKQAANSTHTKAAISGATAPSAASVSGAFMTNSAASIAMNLTDSASLNAAFTNFGTDVTNLREKVKQNPNNYCTNFTNDVATLAKTATLQTNS